jgi:hypothetical protein
MVLDEWLMPFGPVTFVCHIKGIPINLSQVKPETRRQLDAMNIKQKSVSGSTGREV